MALVVDPQGATRGIERGFEPDTCEHVEQRTFGAAVADVIGCDKRNVHRFRKRDQLAIKALLVGIEMALQIDMEIFSTEDRTQPITKRKRIFAARQHPGERTISTAGQTNQPRSESFEVADFDPARALGGILRGTILVATEHLELGGGNHPAEILVAFTIGREDVEPAVIGQRQLRPNQSLEPLFDRRAIEARRAVEPIAITQRDRVAAKFSRAADEIFGRCGAVKETEGAAGAQLDIIGAHDVVTMEREAQQSVLAVRRRVAEKVRSADRFAGASSPRSMLQSMIRWQQTACRSDFLYS